MVVFIDIPTGFLVCMCVCGGGGAFGLLDM